MRSTLRLVLFVTVATAACSETPVSPTPVASAPAVVGAPNLRWDVTANGCAAQAAPSPVPDTNAARINVEPQGALLASWSIVSASNRSSTLYARFLSAGRDWALCTWDTVDQ